MPEPRPGPDGNDYNDVHRAEDVVRRRNRPFLNLVQDISLQQLFEVVIFLTKSEQNGAEVLCPKSALVVIPAALVGHTAVWCLDLVSFEAVHGISRVLRLIPDKLATSLAINRENLPDPDDGGFLIVLVLDLLDHYIKITVEREIRNGNNQLVRGQDKILIFRQELMSNEEYRLVQQEDEDMEENDDGPNEFDEIEGFPTFMKTLSDDLKQLRELLRQRDQDTFLDKSREVLTTCDSMLSACHIYLDFIHPVWINTRRSNSVENRVVADHRLRLNERLEANANKLTNEFNALLIKNHLEE